MPHKPPIKSGETIDAYLARVKSEHVAGGGDGAYSFLSDTTLEFLAAGGDQQAIEELIRRQTAGGEDGGDGGGGGAVAAGATQFASQAALDEAQTRLANANAALVELEAKGQQPISPFQQAQLDIQRKQLELERLRAENDLKEMLMGEIGAERRTLIQEQGAMKRQLLELGPDPFKQSAALSGGVVRGTTPQQAAVGQAQAFIDQPIPTLDFNMTPAQMQAQLGTLQGIEAPTLTGGFGLPSLAHGGVIEMEKKDGAFSMRPSTEQTFLVGDGAGIIPGVTEALTVSNEGGAFSVKVTPLAGMAQGGLELSGTQALAPLFQGLGLDQIPVTRRGPAGEIFGTGFPGVETFTKLGITPRLVRDVATSVVFLIENGQHRRITTEAWEASGFQRGDIVNLSHEDVLKLAPTRGADLTVGFQQQIPTNSPAFQALGTPLIEASTGVAMPAPFKIAAQLGQWQRERPDLFSNALSAFGNVLDPVTGLPTAGLDPFTVLAQMQAATPTGRFSRPQRIGFTGTRL